MTIGQFDCLVESLAIVRGHAKDILSNSEVAEENLYHALGLICHSREPGFACWTHKDLAGYFNTPRECYIRLLESRR